MRVNVGLGSKGRLAVNALIDLALRESAGPVALATVAGRLTVSLSYLEQLFARLRAEGLVHSTRGPGGGYTLKRPAAEITVADIVQVADEPDSAEGRAADVLTHELCQRLQTAMLAHMAGITLQSLVDAQAVGALADVGARATSLASASTPAPARRAFVRRPLPSALRSRVPNSVFAFGASFAAPATAAGLQPAR